MKNQLTINSFGDQFWYNENGNLHREDGPAYERELPTIKIVGFLHQRSYSAGKSFDFPS